MAALLRHECAIVREGGAHTVVEGPAGRQSSVPRHAVINRVTFRKIVKQLGLDQRTIESEVR